MFTSQYNFSMQQASFLQKTRIIILLSLLTFSLQLFSQKDSKFLSSEEDLVHYSEQVYGADNMLVNGRIYVPEHGLAQGHPYYQINDWIVGTVYIESKEYKNVKLKFDLELDEFVIFIKDKDNRKNYIVLNRNYVDSLYLGKFLFVNFSDFSDLHQPLGYVEMVYNNELIFITKHTKDFKKEYSESKPYGEYSDQKSTYYIFEDTQLTKVLTKKAFLNYFPFNKKEIKKYLKKHRIKYKKANSGELFNLLKYCNEIRVKENL